MTDRQIALLAASMKKVYAGLLKKMEPTADDVIEEAEKYYKFLTGRKF